MRAATEELVRELEAAEALLGKLSRKLEKHFEERFDAPGAPNPLVILKRVQKLQAELPVLQDDCQKLLERKQVLVDVAKQQLLLNHERLRDLSVRTGCPAPTPASAEAEQQALQSFQQAMTEWRQQVVGGQSQAMTGTAAAYSRAELNKALTFSMLSQH